MTHASRFPLGLAGLFASSLRLSRAVPLGLPLGLAACVPAVVVPDSPDPESLAREETREIELRFLRLDAKNFVQVLTKKDIRNNFPERVLRDTWLLDMNLEPLIGNALTALIATPAEEAYTLAPSAQNMWKLLNMTPANTVLDGTSLAPLLGVGKAVGLAPSLILSDLVDLDPNANIITVELTTEQVLSHVVATHPNAQKRRGPATAEYPDGLHPVAPNSMPVSLWDVVTDFAELPKNFGPVLPKKPGEPAHPGFIADAKPIVAATDKFSMTVQVNLNALPYKGVDLTDVTVASVNSTSSQIGGVFDFSSNDWLKIDGLAPQLVIEEMTMAIHENPAFIAGGTAKEPEAQGNSAVWDLPLWQFERLIADVARAKAADIPDHCTIYSPEGDVEMPLQAVHVCTGDNGDPDDGTEPADWTTITVDESVILDSPPPKPAYFWDILLEVAQVRLHDGGLAEGKGDIAFTLRDIPVGLTTEALEQQIRKNIQNSPAALAALAELLNENTAGAADFYYYVPTARAPAEQQGDWLYFITPDDIKNNTSGDPERAYGYAHPGFYRDRALTEKVSKVIDIDGDNTHEKVKIAAGDVLYIEDDEGSIFEITVNEPPGRHRIALSVTRVE
jgi:hypothetical protein